MLATLPRPQLPCFTLATARYVSSLSSLASSLPLLALVSRLSLARGDTLVGPHLSSPCVLMQPKRIESKSVQCMQMQRHLMECNATHAQADKEDKDRGADSNENNGMTSALRRWITGT